MDKSLAGLLGVVSVLAVPAHAATALPPDLGAAMRADSYADLLKPIPNALELMKVAAAAKVAPTELQLEGLATTQEVQYWYYRHHHHHHYYRRRWYRHHHYYHHHHHHT
jgi:hypothetical protein